MTTGASIALSLPGRVIASLRLSASTIPLEEILDQLEDYPLRAAATLIRDTASEAGANVALIARPEMFTNPVAIRWLKDRIPRVTQHIALSAGESAGLIPGLPNYLFPFSQSYLADRRRLLRLSQVAPEFLGQFAAIINYGLPNLPTMTVRRRFSHAQQAYRDQFTADSWHLFCGAEHLYAQKDSYTYPTSQLPEHVINYSNSTFVFCSENALNEQEFVNLICHEISKSVADPERLLLIYAPVARVKPTNSNCSATLRVFYDCLRQSAIALPPMVTSNVVVLNSPPSVEVIRAVRRPSLLAASDFPFWWYAEDVYTSFRHLKIWTPATMAIHGGVSKDIISCLCGLEPTTWRRQ